jgi:protein O-GlcNAc transferase
MDYQKFSQQLPRLYENWGQDAIKAKNCKFQQLLNQVEGSTANVMQVLNFAVDCMEPDEIYCQIGIDRTSLVASLLDRPDRMAYVVDNLSEDEGDRIEQLLETLQKFNLEEQVIFCNQEVEEFWWELQELGIENKIGVYFYNGLSDYRCTLLGLLLSRNFLANQALIIVGHANSLTVQQATWDFMATNPECQVALELFNSGKASSSFGDGLQVLSWDIERSDRYSAITFQEHRQPPVIQAIYNLHQLEESLEKVYQEALTSHQQQQLELAEKKYKEYLLWRSHDAEAWLNLGKVQYETANYQAAITALFKSLEIDAANGELHYSIGLCLEKLNQIDQALAAYQQAIELNPNIIDAYHHLGTLLEQKGQISEAESIYQKAIASHPSHFGSYLNLGNLLLAQDRVEEAIATYQTALTFNPGYPDILHNIEIAQDIESHPEKYYREFAERFYKQGQYEKAIAKYRQLLEVSQGDALVYAELRDCFDKLNLTDEAIKTLQAGVSIHPSSGNLHFSLITKLLYQGRTKDAIASAENASRQLPEDYTFTILKHLIVPLLYHSPEEISFISNDFK